MVNNNKESDFRQIFNQHLIEFNFRFEKFTNGYYIEINKI